MRATRHPCAASRRAVAEPAGPPPTTATSKVTGVGCSDIGMVVLALALAAEECEAFAKLVEVEPGGSQVSLEIVANSTASSDETRKQLAQPFVALAQIVD